MPVMPGYIHADTPHEKTIQHAGYLYGRGTPNLTPPTTLRQR